MSTDNSQLGTAALLTWYQAASLSSAGISFDDALAYYADNAPATFIRVFGDIIVGSGLSQFDVNGLMQSLGQAKPGKYPNWQNFTQSVIDKQSSFRYEFVGAVKAGLVDTGSEIATAAKWGGSILIIVAIALATVYVVIKAKR